MADKKPTPDTPSGDYGAMQPYWAKVQTMLDGTDAMRAAGEKYLPRFPMETKEDYEHRRKNAKFTNIFRDIVENLAAKPFAKTLTVKESSVSSEIKALAEDIDGAGNHIHVFAGETFFFGIAKALDYIFVDYTKVPVGATLAAEKAMGARPYWVRMPAERVVAAYADMVDGKEEFVHVRVLEPTTVRDGFGERNVERVRVYDRAEIMRVDPATGASIKTYDAATWILYEKQKAEHSQEWVWVPIDNGVLRIGVIPLVAFLTGRRKGTSWRLNPPMQDAADVQIKHYQQETNLECAKELSCFSMLKGEGINPAMGKDGKPQPIPRGPNAVLYAPMDANGNHGTWGTVEPTAESMKFVAAEMKETVNQLRELGRQPLTAQTGNLTVVTTAFAAQKGNSAVQAWALNLKDALERALQLTCLWLEDEASKPEVEIYTDFGIDMQDGSSMQRLIEMRKNGDLTQDTLWAEGMRRGELSPEFDAEAEKKALREEGPDPDAEDDLAAARTPPANSNDPALAAA